MKSFFLMKELGRGRPLLLLRLSAPLSVSCKSLRGSALIQDGWEPPPVLQEPRMLLTLLRASGTLSSGTPVPVETPQQGFEWPGLSRWVATVFQSAWKKGTV